MERLLPPPVNILTVFHNRLKFQTFSIDFTIVDEGKYCVSASLYVDFYFDKPCILQEHRFDRWVGDPFTRSIDTILYKCIVDGVRAVALCIHQRTKQKLVALSQEWKIGALNGTRDCTDHDAEQIQLVELVAQEQNILKYTKLLQNITFCLSLFGNMISNRVSK